MDPHRQRRDGEPTRERLLRAALDLYTTTGFLQTTTPTLARRAQVAEGTIYRHFSSKEHLLNEAHRRAHGWAIEALKALENDRVRRPPERLALLARQIVDMAAQDPAIVRMLLSQAHEHFLDDQSRGIHREFMDGLAQLVAMGKSDGQIRSGPAELWAQVWLTIVGSAAERVAAGEWTPDSSPVGLTLEAAWDAIATARPASTPGT
jgi:AcrR family transcriptional regulator